MARTKGSILIVEDDEHVALTSKMILKQYFENIDTLPSPKLLESILRQNKYEVVLLDMNFSAGVTSGNEGIFWMKRIQSIAPETQIVLQTAYADIELAVKSMKGGAVDFLPKPWDKEKLVSTMMTAYELARSRKDHGGHHRSYSLKDERNRAERIFIAGSPSMKAVIEVIDQVASTDANVLILGENGTGKELVARAIHEKSKRAHGPFVLLDVGTIAPSLFETEIFGVEKGAFTDAKETRIGKIELANSGTLFLDEIGNLPLELQVKLLSVIQSRTLTKVGSNKSINADIRVVCATNAPIQALVKSGEFRQDLFYRINTVEIALPPLRERKEDIPQLIDHYLKDFCHKYQKNVTLDADSLPALVSYHWQGNIRELRHAVERAVILSRQPILAFDDFQLSASIPSVSSTSLKLSNVEKDTIRQALRKWNGNLTRASEELGIGRSTLYRKMEEYQIRVEDPF